MRAELDAARAYAIRLHDELESVRAVGHTRAETIKRLETETHGCVAEIARLRSEVARLTAPVVDDTLVEAACEAWHDPGKWADRVRRSPSVADDHRSRMHAALAAVRRFRAEEGGKDAG